MLLEVGFVFAEHFLTHIRRIPDNCVKAGIGAGEHFRKGFLPVEDIDAVMIFFGEEGKLG